MPNLNQKYCKSTNWTAGTNATTATDHIFTFNEIQHKIKVELKIYSAQITQESNLISLSYDPIRPEHHFIRPDSNFKLAFIEFQNSQSDLFHVKPKCFTQLYSDFKFKHIKRFQNKFKFSNSFSHTDRIHS